jgi:hypothetical protein
MLNALENFNIYRETLNNNHLNDKYTVTPNAIFDAILRHNSDSTPRIYTRTLPTCQSPTERAHDSSLRNADIKSGYTNT